MVDQQETKTVTTSSRGGARPGAGRKKLKVPTKVVNFRLTAEQEKIVREFVDQLKKNMQQ